MKWNRLLGFVLVISLSFTAQTATGGETIQIATGHWPPYLDENQADGGFLAKIVREAFAHENIDVEFTFFPWSRALSLVKSGRYQASAVWACTPERLQDFLYSAPILPFHYVFYHRKRMPFDWNTKEDLVGLKVGITQDYSYGQTLNSAIENRIVQADTTTSDLANLRKLLLKRIDLFPIDPVVGENMIAEQLGPKARERLTFHPKPLSNAFYHLPFSREDPKADYFRRAFDRGLSKLRETDLYQAIIESALEAHSSPSAAAILENKLVNWDKDTGPCY